MARTYNRQFNELDLQLVNGYIDGLITKYRLKKILGINETKANELIKKEKSKRVLVWGGKGAPAPEAMELG